MFDFNASERNNVVNKIKNLITEGELLLGGFEGKKNAEIISDEYESWRRKAIILLDSVFSDGSLSNSFLLKTESFRDMPTGFKGSERLDVSFSEGICLLKRIESEVLEGIYDNLLKLPECKTTICDEIAKPAAILIIRRILCNLNKHIQAMYQDKVHGKGTLKQEDLEKIKIGNEYDVQRILYALLRSIFPEIRLERVDDAMYKSVRADLFLDEFNIIIEVKCSRESMDEKDLAEQLGSDAFHYRGDYLFLFIFDQKKIIKNIDAFEKAYKRDKGTFGKDVETIVAQPITF